jgi:phage terminase small subunit
MTPLQQRFAEEYLVDLNATQAAIRAGYKPSAAKRLGTRLLANPEVSAVIAKGREKVSERTGLTVELIDRKLLDLVSFDPRKLLKDDGSLAKPSEWDDATAAAVAGLEVDEIGVEGVVIGHTKKLKIADRIRPLELAFKRLGVLRDTSVQVGQLNLIIQE